jgi:hypothetical protein
MSLTITRALHSELAGDRLAMALAALGRAIEARETGGITGVHEAPRNTPKISIREH